MKPRKSYDLRGPKSGSGRSPRALSRSPDLRRTTKRWAAGSPTPVPAATRRFRSLGRTAARIAPDDYWVRPFSAVREIPAGIHTPHKEMRPLQPGLVTVSPSRRPPGTSPGALAWWYESCLLSLSRLLLVQAADALLRAHGSNKAGRLPLLEPSRLPSGTEVFVQCS